jgi:hypothetical protein
MPLGFAKTTVTDHGNTYEFAELTVGDLLQLHEEVVKKLPAPPRSDSGIEGMLDQFVGDPSKLEGLPPEEVKEHLRCARRDAHAHLAQHLAEGRIADHSWPPHFTDPGWASHLCSSRAGVRLMGFISLKKCDPSMTKDRAAGIVDSLSLRNYAVFINACMAVEDEESTDAPKGEATGADAP